MSADGCRDDDRITTLRVPPQSIESEQAVLGGLMLAPESIYRVMDLLTAPEVFYRHDHRLIFRAILDMRAAGRPFDVVTMGDWFDRHGLADQIGGSAYMIELASTTPSAANIAAYAEIVQEKHLLRLMIEAGSELVDQAFTAGDRAPVQLLADAQAKLGQVLQGQPSELESPDTVIAEIIEDATAADEKPAIQGLTTGLPDLDAILGGLRAGQLIVIAGRPKMGKSTLAQNIAEHVAMRLRKRVAIHTLEMQPKELLSRSICSLGDIDADRLRHNTLTEAEWASWSKVTGLLSRAPLRISKPRNVRVEQLIAQTQRDHARAPFGLVVVDYLQLVNVSHASNQNIGYGEVTRQLKLMAGILGCPVILLSQLNRELERRPNKRPVLSDLRDSGAIEQDADAIVFVYRDEIYHKKSPDKGTAEIIVEAQRSGRPGMARVLADLDHYRFRSLPFDWEPAVLPLEPDKPGTTKKFKKRGYSEERDP